MRFGPGLCAGDEPDARWTGDDGVERLWLMVGLPDPQRLEQFTRRCERLALLASGPDPDRWWRRHRERLTATPGLSLLAFEDDLPQRLAARLARRLRLSMTVSDARVYLEDGSGWRSEDGLRLWLGPREPGC